jgi:hypothetical protein
MLFRDDVLFSVSRSILGNLEIYPTSGMAGTVHHGHVRLSNSADGRIAEGRLVARSAVNFQFQRQIPLKKLLQGAFGEIARHRAIEPERNKNGYFFLLQD